MKTWRYSAGGFGWYVAFVDESGAVSILSDYGNYGYFWHRRSLPYSDEQGGIRKFLTSCDASYVLSKLATRDEFDPQATKQRFKSFVLEFRRSHPKPQFKEICRMAYSGIDEIADWDELGFYDFIRDCDLDGANETLVYDYPQQAQAFMTEVWPRIVDDIKKDLT